MSERSQRSTSSRLHAVPVGTWVGLGASVLVALLGLAAGGAWLMLTMVAIVVLLTASYGLLFRRSTWIRLPRKRAGAALGAGIAFVVLIGSTAAFGATHPEPAQPVERAAIVATTAADTHAQSRPVHTKTPRRPHTATPTPTPTPVVTTKEVSETSPVPFSTSTVQSATLAQGTSSVTTPGVAGVETKTYRITLTDGVETGRTLTSDVVTTPPVNQVTTIGTYVAPPPPPAAPTCTNGTYVNSAGNTVCRPEVSSSAPSGATARCTDGTYSFSQSRRGTCSSHGGVAQWL